MGKSKQFLGSSKKSSKNKDANIIPATADDFLAVGVDHEEAGEKWRAGDSGKSSRFFVRALEDYQVGLQKFPVNFDLAYNKARLQYDIAQQPKLLSHLPFSLFDLLNLALDSHRYALRIKQDNADLLFNTAQLLTSITEASIETRSTSHTPADDLRNLREALEFFQRCLSLQEIQLRQNKDLAASTAASPAADCNGNSEGAQGGSPYMSQEVWVSIEEPVTNDSLIDTVLAQLGTLTTICTLVSVHGNEATSWIEGYYREVLLNRFHLLSNGSERWEEMNLVKAKFLTAYEDACFRAGAIDISTYEHDLETAYAEDLILNNNGQGLCDRAEARMTFHTSITAFAQTSVNISEGEYSQLNNIRWTQITKALGDLTAATKLPHPENLPRTHLRRGDCELMRYGLTKGELPYELAAKSAPTLVKNAEVYYRGAAKLAQSMGATEEEHEALVKEAVVTKLLGDPRKLRSLSNSNLESTMEIVRDMQDEYLLYPDDMAKLNE